MRIHYIAGLGAALALCPLAPHTARACGGFFCNNQAVDQSGERILYSYAPDGSITTIVQILYSGPSEQFAWILPVPMEPVVDVGTDALFTALEGRTAPQFTLDYTRTGSCRQQPACYWGDDYDRTSPSGSFRDAAAFEQDAGSRGVEVVSRQSIGPYDAVVLSSGDGDALRAWLSDNGYLIPESAGAELDHYVELDHYFVALKLLSDRSAGEIQPIILRSSNEEPCIPLRLTRIASVTDMPITVYFLADRRVRPANYMLAYPDLEQMDLWYGRLSYRNVAGAAIDDLGGHAFVTDYAGDVPTISIAYESIEDLRTVTDAAQFLTALQSRGFLGDSQLLGLLTRFIPPPSEYEYDPQTFYNCLNTWCQADVAGYLATFGFDPNAFVDALNDAIVDPRREADEMLRAHAHMTRLFTTMSPDEMTEDPMFERVDGGLPRNVSNIHRATLETECAPEYFEWTAPQTFVFASGREQFVREGVAYRGTDSEFCEDYEDGFRPGTTTTRLRELARARAVRPSGGACSAGGEASSGFAISIAVAALTLVVRRRKKY